MTTDTLPSDRHFHSYRGLTLELIGFPREADGARDASLDLDQLDRSLLICLALKPSALSGTEAEVLLDSFGLLFHEPFCDFCSVPAEELETWKQDSTSPSPAYEAALRLLLLELIERRPLLIDYVKEAYARSRIPSQPEWKIVIDVSRKEQYAPHTVEAD